MSKTSNQPLRLTPYAWAKLLYLRDLGNTEVGGFGISAADTLLLIADICLIKQVCTEVTVRFDDQAVADFFDVQVDAELPPQRFARIWVHTHPGASAQLSNTDEETFGRCFGSSNWAIMFILARGGQTYTRLRLNAGPSGDLVLPVEVDFTQPFPAAAQAAWEQEYQRAVRLEQLVTWEPRPERRLSFALAGRVRLIGVDRATHTWTTRSGTTSSFIPLWRAYMIGIGTRFERQEGLVPRERLQPLSVSVIGVAPSAGRSRCNSRRWECPDCSWSTSTRSSRRISRLRAIQGPALAGPKSWRRGRPSTTSIQTFRSR